MTYFDNLPYEPEFDHLMRDYRQRHKYCPACGGCNVSTTLVTYMTNEKVKYAMIIELDAYVDGWAKHMSLT